MELQFFKHVDRQSVRCAWSNRNRQTQRACLIDQIEDIGAPQRIPSCEDQMRERLVEARDLAKQSLAFIVRQLVRMWSGYSFGAAVPASQRTSLSHLPIDQQRGAGIIVFAQRMRMSRLRFSPLFWRRGNHGPEIAGDHFRSS